MVGIADRFEFFQFTDRAGIKQLQNARTAEKSADERDLTSRSGAQATRSTTERVLSNSRLDTINVMDFGADPNKIGDNTASFQSAISAARLQGRSTITIPAGNYYFDLAAPPLDPGTDDIEFAGDGMNSSILNWDEGPGRDTNSPTYKSLFRNTDKVVKGRISFRNLQFRGTLFSSSGRLNEGGPALFLNNYKGISLVNVRFQNISNMATQCEGIGEVLVTGSVFDTVMRDMVRFRSSFNVRVVGNQFIHSDDDAVALHHSLFRQLPGQIGEGIVVEGNIFEDTLGVHILGARVASVQNNVFRRSKVHPISISPDSSEGPNPMFAINVSNNVITDTLPRIGGTAAQSAIELTVQNPREGIKESKLGASWVEQTGIREEVPYKFGRSNVNTKGDPMPPGYGVTLSNNVVMRTLDPVEKYSAWGYGPALTRNGWSDDPITDQQLRPELVLKISVNVVGLNVHDNYLANSNGCIGFLGSPTIETVSLNVHDNIFYDCPAFGAKLLNSAATSDIAGKFHDNDFNLDPYLVASGRNADGSWDPGVTNSTAIDFPGVSGLVFNDNTFQNCYQPSSNDIGRGFARDNIIRADVHSIGYSTLNLGVGVIPEPGVHFWLHLLGRNTSKSSIASSVYATPQAQTAMPASGFFVKGTFIRNASPEALAVFGWLRLTTGSAHSFGKDWKAIPLR